MQLENAQLPIDVTLLGMVREVRPLHLWKAASAMDVTLLGMVTELRPVQSLNLQLIVYQSILI